MSAIKYKDPVTGEWKIASSLGGGGLEPLIGTTDEITPMQVAEAVAEGRTVAITHTDDELGVPITFDSFALIQDMQISSTCHIPEVLVNEGEGLVHTVNLIGGLSDNVWISVFINDEGGGGSIDVTAEVGQTIVVEEVDGNGKPTKWKAAEYQPRTHWTEVVQGDLVPHMAFTPVMNEAFQMLMYNLPVFDFEAGKTYTVIFDGVEYTGIAEAGVTSGIPFVSVGNTILHGVQSTEPFIVAQIPAMNVFAVVCFTDDEHTIQIIGEKTVHHKIPDEYVRGDNFKIEVSISATGDGFIANKTFEEIAEAVQAGKNVFVEEKNLYSNGVGISHLKFENFIDSGDSGGEAMFTALEDAGVYIRLVVMKIGRPNYVRRFEYEMLSI